MGGFNEKFVSSESATNNKPKDTSGILGELEGLKISTTNSDDLKLSKKEYFLKSRDVIVQKFEVPKDLISELVCKDDNKWYISNYEVTENFIDSLHQSRDGHWCTYDGFPLFPEMDQLSYKDALDDKDIRDYKYYNEGKNNY